VLSKGEIRRIAVGIFFLGLQFFHMSLLMVILAKFLRMHNQKYSGSTKIIEANGERSILVTDSSRGYPSVPSYSYSNSPHYRREPGYYQPSYGPEPTPEPLGRFKGQLTCGIYKVGSWHPWYIDTRQLAPYYGPDRPGQMPAPSTSTLQRQNQPYGGTGPR